MPHVPDGFLMFRFEHSFQDASVSTQTFLLVLTGSTAVCFLMLSALPSGQNLATQLHGFLWALLRQVDPDMEEPS